MTILIQMKPLLNNRFRPQQGILYFADIYNYFQRLKINTWYSI